MERYLDAARKISRLAVGDPAMPVMVNIHPLDRRASAGRARRRAAVRHARRPGGPQRLPGGRHLRRQGGARRRRRASRTSSKSRSTASAVSARARSVGRRRRGGRGGRGGGAAGAARSSFRCRSRPAHGSSAWRSCSAPRRATRRRCGRACAAAARSRRSRRVTISGPYDVDRAGRLAEPPAHLHCCRLRRRRPADELAVRAAQHPVDAGAPRLPASGRPTRTCSDLMPFYAAGRAEGSFDLGIQKALERLLVSSQFLFRIERAAGRAPRPRRSVSASAISSWRRACRSSCGAAFPTTSCSTWRWRAA